MLIKEKSGMKIIDNTPMPSVSKIFRVFIMKIQLRKPPELKDIEIQDLLLCEPDHIESLALHIVKL